MREAEIIKHNGKEIVFLNYSNLKTKEEIEYLTVNASKIIRSKPLKTVLSLVNLEGMHFNNEIKSVIADNLKLNQPHVKKSAAYGLTGLLGAFFAGYIKLTGREVKPCKSQDEAIQFLTSD